MELLRLKNQNFKIIEYLKVKIDKLKLTIDEILDLITVSPILLQRPLIIKYIGYEPIKTIISRPSERTLSLISY